MLLTVEETDQIEESEVCLSSRIVRLGVCPFSCSPPLLPFLLSPVCTVIEVEVGINTIVDMTHFTIDYKAINIIQLV